MSAMAKAVVVIVMFYNLNLFTVYKAKSLMQLAQQIQRKRCGNLPRSQGKAIQALTGKEPTRKEIQLACYILSRGDTFPEFASHLFLINGAMDLFYDVPGFRQKMRNCLCCVNQEGSVKEFLREIDLAVSIETGVNDEKISDFDQEYKIGEWRSTFALITNRRWVSWYHGRLYPGASHDSIDHVAKLKALFATQKIVADRYSRLSNNPVQFFLEVSYPIHKSWKRWFKQQGIYARYYNDSMH